VTQRNTGRRAAGIDGLVALTSQARAEMAVRVHASTVTATMMVTVTAIAAPPSKNSAVSRMVVKLKWEATSGASCIAIAAPWLAR